MIFFKYRFLHEFVFQNARYEKGRGNTFVEFMQLPKYFGNTNFRLAPFMPLGHIVNFYLKQKLLFFQKLYQHLFSQQIQEVQD